MIHYVILYSDADTLCGKENTPDIVATTNRTQTTCKACKILLKGV